MSILLGDRLWFELLGEGRFSVEEYESVRRRGVEEVDSKLLF